MARDPVLLQSKGSINEWAIRAVGLVSWFFGFVALFLGEYPSSGILIAVGGGLMFGSKRIKEAFTLKTVADHLRDADLEAAYRNALLGAATTPPPPLVLTVGRVIDSEFFASHIGISTEGGICKFTEYLLDRHGMILGELGAGKSTAIQTLSQQVVRYTNRDVFAIDYKGKESDAVEQWRIIAEHRPNAKLVRLDPDKPIGSYNPFKYGDALALSNRWMRVFETADANEYYGGLLESVILLICHGDIEPPRSLREFKERATETWFATHYPKGHADYDMAQMITRREKGQYSPLERLQLRSVRIFKHLERFITEDGWTPDDGSAVISVPAAKIPESAQIIAGLLIEDFKHFMSARQIRPCEILWDEFQSAGLTKITELLSQSRSFHCGVFLASQDINKLGTELEQRVLTSDTTTLITFRTQQSAGFVARMSGTVRRAAVTKQLLEGGVGAGGSVREEEEYRIHPDDIAQLPDGYCYILKNRTYCKVKFNVADIPVNVPPEPVYTPVVRPTLRPPTLQQEPRKPKPQVREME